MSDLPHIILIHGASSAGKSTLARAVQDQTPVPFWHWSIDHLRDSGAIPQHRFTHRDFDWHDHRQLAFSAFHASITAFAASGIRLIVEHILDDAHMRSEFREATKNFDVFRVGLHTDLATLNIREAMRENRPLGSAARDFRTVHTDMVYDIELDGTHPADQNAALLLQHLQSPPA